MDEIKTQVDEFAKLLVVDGHQVLITKDDDEKDDDPFILTQRTVYSGLNATVKLGFYLEEKRDAAFTGYNLENAVTFITGVKKFLLE